MLRHEPGEIGANLRQGLLVLRNDRVSAVERAELRSMGVRITSPMGRGVFEADLSSADLDDLDSSGLADWAGDVPVELRVQPSLAGSAPVAAGPGDAGPGDAGAAVPMLVWLFEGADADAAAVELESMDGVQVDARGDEGGQAVLHVSGPVSRAGEIAALDGVRWVEEAPVLTDRVESARWIIQTNEPGYTPLYDAGLTGLGQIIGVIDGQVHAGHCVFSDPEGDPPGPDHRKIEAYNASFGANFHGTHVAGIALGDTGEEDLLRGVAYEARMVFNTRPSYTEAQVLARFDLHASQGAFIHTNSWGEDRSTSYDGLVRAIDLFTWENEDHIVLFAVTNLDNLRTPENAKNVLAVAATKDEPQQSLFCSGGVGPTQDGRRKPEIMAPGCSIVAANNSSSCGTRMLTGTSMATPAVAGAAAMVRQYFTQGYYPTGELNPADAMTPTGALLRAVLLNATVDLTDTNRAEGYPSDQEGWGRLLLADSLTLPGLSRSLIVEQRRRSEPGALDTGGTFEMDISVLDSTEPLKITMAFNDYPGAIGAFDPVINDLDLEVVTPSRALLYGNGFDAAIGRSVPGGGPDPQNSVERVVLHDPEPGVYTVRVRASDVQMGPQGFAVAISGDVDRFLACPWDLDGSGSIGFFDVIEFLEMFAAEDPAADFDGDGGVGFFDFVGFLTILAEGCP